MAILHYRMTAHPAVYISLTKKYTFFANKNFGCLGTLKFNISVTLCSYPIKLYHIDCRLRIKNFIQSVNRHAAYNSDHRG